MLLRKTKKNLIYWEHYKGGNWWLCVGQRMFYQVLKRKKSQLWNVVIAGRNGVLCSYPTAAQAKAWVENQIKKDLNWMVEMIQLTDKRTRNENNESSMDLQPNC